MDTTQLATPQIDWPMILLITYAFILLLILVLLITKGRKGAHTKYAKTLEEKEEKLLRMQIDMEETLSGMETFAEQMQSDWKRMQKQEQGQLEHLKKRLMELEAAFLTLRARVTSMEIRRPPTIEAVPPPMPKETPTATIEQKEESMVQETEDEYETMLSLVRQGCDLQEIAKRMQISRTEAELLYNRYLRQN